jgi:flagellar biosynthetic protein FliR
MLQISSSQLDALITQFIWPFLRILSLFLIAPVFSHRAIPARIKLGLALAVTVVVAPVLAPAPAGAFGDARGWLLVAEQMLVGFALGMSLQIVFASLALAGDMMGLQMGIGFATFVDPQNSTQTPLIGSFLAMLGTLLFLGMDGHTMVLQALVESFEAIPVGGMLTAELRWDQLAAMGSGIFSLGLQIALPLLATMLICNLAMGVMARAAPQLNLFSVGFPLTVLAGLGLLVFFLPFLGTPFMEAIPRAIWFWRR